MYTYIDLAIKFILNNLLRSGIYNFQQTKQSQKRQLKVERREYKAQVRIRSQGRHYIKGIYTMGVRQKKFNGDIREDKERGHTPRARKANEPIVCRMNNYIVWHQKGPRHDERASI